MRRMTMAKERILPCLHYICEGSCNIKNKKCRFWKEMQICSSYKKKEGAAPARTDKRKQKLEKLRKRELRDAY